MKRFMKIMIVPLMAILMVFGAVGSADATVHGDRIIQLGTNKTMYAGDSLVASNGCNFQVQTDGNLVVYRPNGTVAWQAGSNNAHFEKLVVQNDGNVVAYAYGPYWTWATWTGGPYPKNTMLVMQTDCNLVLYQLPYYNVLWQSGSHL